MHQFLRQSVLGLKFTLKHLICFNNINEDTKNNCPVKLEPRRAPAEMVRHGVTLIPWHRKLLMKVYDMKILNFTWFCRIMLIVILVFVSPSFLSISSFIHPFFNFFWKLYDLELNITQKCMYVYICFLLGECENWFKMQECVEYNLQQLGSINPAGSPSLPSLLPHQQTPNQDESSSVKLVQDVSEPLLKVVRLWH